MPSDITERDCTSCCGLRRAGVLTLVLAAAFGGVACTSLPLAATSEVWTDTRGDRGNHVLARDLEACQISVESKRSLVASCMALRGWASL